MEGGVNIVAADGSAATGYVSIQGDIVTNSTDPLANNSSFVEVSASGDATLTGTIQARGTVRLQAGVIASGAYTGYANTRGGDIVLGSASNITSNFGHYAVTLHAERGASSGNFGNIIQYGGGMVSAPDGNGKITLYAGANAQLDGSISAGDNIWIEAGNGQMYGYGATGFGGNIMLGATSNIVSSGGYVYLEALSGTHAPGNITQTAGGTLRGNTGIEVYAEGSATIGGSVTTDFVSDGWDVKITAGNGSGGGNIVIGASGVIEASADVRLYAYGGSNEPGNITVNGSLSGYYGANLRALGGGVSVGRITQAAGSIMSSGNSDINIYGVGDIALAGSLAAYDSVFIKAGYDYDLASFAATPYNASVGSVTGAYASIEATGAISGGMITAPTVVLASHYGGSAGVPAISANTAASASIDAMVNGGSAFGGIHIVNTSAAQPSSISLIDDASANSAVSFTQNFTAGGTLSTIGLTLQASPGGSIALASNGGLDIVTNFGSGRTNLALKGTTVDISAMLQGYGGVAVNADSVTIGSGGGISSMVDLGVIANNLQLNGGSLDAGRYLVIAHGNSGSVDASGVLSYTKTGGTNLTAYGGSISAQESMYLTLSNGLLDGTQVSTYYGDIDASVQQNLVLNNGASFSAGNDIWLTLLGGDSKLILNESAGMTPSKIIADTYTNDGRTIHIDFPSRQSGGIVIDGTETSVTQEGGSGFYWGSPPVVATAGNGLTITYDANTSIAVILDALEKAKDEGLLSQEDYFVLQEYIEANAALFDQTAGGDESQFGEEENKGKGKKKAGMCRG
jgi:hypothetical protein